VFIEDRAVLTLRGEVDLATAPLLLRDALDALAQPVAAIAIDLGCVTFMDSAGVATLLAIQRGATGRGMRFTLASLTEPARRAIEGVGLRTEFGLA
jgi:anti-anti-sigma factor